MGLVIKKRVSLAYLGEEYKDSFLILKSIPMSYWEKLKDEKVEDVVREYFISGHIYQEEGYVDIAKENFDELPAEVVVDAFAKLCGELDPKPEGQSITQSPTTPPLPQK